MMFALNSREKKQLLTLLKEQWGYKGKLPQLYRNQDGKVYASTATLPDDKTIRIEGLGLYIGQFQKDGFSLSIEGSQLIGPHARKNMKDATPDE
ncbi:MAG: hypothetical protein ABIH34_07410, partial [Nanoarchaeota archaeon]